MEKEKEESLKEEIKADLMDRIRKEIKEDDSPGGLFIPAGVLSGLGFGFLFNELVAGLFIGLGAGFALFAIYEIIRVNKNR